MNIIEVYKRFPTQDDCLSYLEQVKWNGKPHCPYCGSFSNTPMKNERRYHCNTCNISFSVTVRTIFHKTKVDLQKWFLAISLILNAKKGIGSRQIARDISVNRNTAWYMGMRIRRAMYEQQSRELLQGIVEMDETYIGGKPRRGANGGTPNKRGRGTKKTPVVGMVERGGKIKAKVVKKEKLNHRGLSALVREHIDTKKATLITDEYRGYMGMSKYLPHQFVNHQEWYTDGDIHTNSVESFWALLKRGIVGQFHKVSVRHLPKYIDEFCYRQNHRQEDIFGLTISRALGV